MPKYSIELVVKGDEFASAPLSIEIEVELELTPVDLRDFAKDLANQCRMVAADRLVVFGLVGHPTIS